MHAERYAHIGERIRICFSAASRRKPTTYIYFLTDEEYRRYEAQDHVTGANAIHAQRCLAVFHDRPEAFWGAPESRRWHVLIDLPGADVAFVDVVE